MMKLTCLVRVLTPNITRRDTTTSYYDKQFGVHIPFSIMVDTMNSSSQKQDLIATAHRCMNEWCFFKPARAYVVGLFVDSSTNNRLRTFEAGTTTANSRDVMYRTDCPKSFVLYFASTKDSSHIRRGFRRSFETFTKARGIDCPEKINDYLSVLAEQSELRKDDYIRVSCIPSADTVVVSFNDVKQVRITDARCLIDWIHSLYVGLEDRPEARYRSMQAQLTSDASVSS